MRRLFAFAALLLAAGVVRAQEAVPTYAVLNDVRIAPTERAAEVA